MYISVTHMKDIKIFANAHVAYEYKTMKILK